MSDPAPRAEGLMNASEASSATNSSFSKDQDMNLFQCELCGKSYAKRRGLMVHLRVHTGEKTFKCSLCSMRFTYYKQLQAHMIEHTGETPFNCPHCPMVFKLMPQLRKHVSYHKFKCQHCQRAFRDEGTLKTHLRIHAPSQKFECGFCPRQFFDKRTLQSHMQVHCEQSSYECTICFETFPSDSVLEAHFEDRHNGDLHRCLFCLKQFFSSYNMNLHLRQHLGEKGYSCSMCSSTFKYSSELTVHEKCHAGELCKCYICGQYFESVGDLKGHIMNHFECYLCSRKFKNQLLLEQHKYVHRSEIEYDCAICSKCFKSSDEMQMHVMLEHSDYLNSTGKTEDSGEGNHARNDVYFNEQQNHTESSDPTDTETSSEELETSKDTSDEGISTTYTLRKSRNKIQSNKFTCKQCPKTFSNMNRLKSHRKDHLARQVYKCLHCPKTFSGLMNLNQHLKTHLRDKRRRREVGDSTLLSQLPPSPKKLASGELTLAYNEDHQAMKAITKSKQNKKPGKKYQKKEHSRIMSIKKDNNYLIEEHLLENNYKYLVEANQNEPLKSEKKENPIEDLDSLDNKEVLYTSEVFESPFDDKDIKCDITNTAAGEEPIYDTTETSNILPEVESGFFCIICGKIYNNEKALWDHLLSHELLDFPSSGNIYV